MNSHVVPESKCTRCGMTFDHMSNVGPDQTGVPKNGSVAICFDCHHVMIWENNAPRDPNDAELIELANNHTIICIPYSSLKLTEH